MAHMQTQAAFNHLMSSLNTFPSDTEETTNIPMYNIHTLTKKKKSKGIFYLFFSLSLSLCLWRTLAGIREKSSVARRQVVVAMVNLSGTAGPISIKCGQAGAEPAKLMPTQTDRKKRLLRHAG